MSLQIHQQFLNTLDQAKRPIIVLTQNANADDFATAFGCATLLKKMQKPIEIVTSGGRVPKSLEFLKPPTKVRGDLPNINKLTLRIDSKKAKIDELSYEVKGDELHIHITPKVGSWNKEDVQISTDAYRYDLIIAIGGADLDSFGQLYELYADFFFETPIINIDHTSANEHFGQINLVDINAVSCSEVCHDLFERIDATLIDEEVATYLLTGMIFKTRGFRSNNVSPKTLKVAGSLMARGARRDEIVQKLYKTRSVETLRLWGRALARLKSSSVHGLVWTLLTRQDFVSAGAGEASLENVIDELMMSSPEARVAAVFYENADKSISVILKVDRPYDALFLGAPFKAAGGREEALLRLSEIDIVNAERQAITHLKQQLESKELR